MELLLQQGNPLHAKLAQLFAGYFVHCMKPFSSQKGSNVLRELGWILSGGRMAMIESDFAVQKSDVAELKTSVPVRLNSNSSSRRQPQLHHAANAPRECKAKLFVINIKTTNTIKTLLRTDTQEVVLLINCLVMSNNHRITLNDTSTVAKAESLCPDSQPTSTSCCILLKSRGALCYLSLPCHLHGPHHLISTGKKTVIDINHRARTLQIACIGYDREAEGIKEHRSGCHEHLEWR